MWLLGMLAGLILGVLGGSFELALGGAVLGAVAGAFFQRSRGGDRPAGEDRLRALEAKLDWLYRQHREMQARIQALEGTALPAASAPPAAPDQAEAGTPAADSAARPESGTQTVTPQPLEPPPAEPAEPAPSAAEAAEPSLWSRLVAGNLLAKIGVVLLFFGVASALKLAVEHGLFPVQLRLLMSSVTAVAMIVFGWTRRDMPERRVFGLSLQGGGFALLYLVVFFMLARYHMIGNGLAFALFAVLGLACVLLAVRQDGVALAVLGIAGAFLAPVLAATSSGNHIALFSYFALLNAFIIGVDWFKSWRPLNLTGFVFTFVIGMSWALGRYRPEFYAETQAFLILFFLMYSATPVLSARFRAPGFRGWSDGLLVFGTPLVAAALQVPLVREYEYGLAWSAFAAGLYYLSLWGLLAGGRDAQARLMETSHLGIAVVFLTVAVPLAFGVQVTSAFWAAEGVAMLWFGLRQKRRPAQVFGLLVQLAAGIWFVFGIDELQRATPLLNDVFVGGMLIAGAGFIGAWLLREEGEVAPAALVTAPVLLWWGLAWWFGTGLSEIGEFAGRATRVPYSLFFATASAAALEGYGRGKRWSDLRWPALLLLPFAIACAVLSTQAHRHVLAGFMVMAFPLAMLAHYWMLSRQDDDGLDRFGALRHLVAFWLLAAVAGRELAWIAGELAPGVTLWPLLAWGAVAAATLHAVVLGVGKNLWPFAARPSDYLEAGALPVALVLAVWSAVANLSHSGAGFALPYVPLLNPFDLVQLIALASLGHWARGSEAAPASPLRRRFNPIAFGLGFLWLSAMAARITHHWGEVPFRFHDLFHSVLLQSLLSLLWTAVAIGLMILATRRLRRELWYGGFGLLTLVGVKLLVIDLANSGTLTWTASLIGVALLVLAAAYFAPAPPKAGVEGPASHV